MEFAISLKLYMANKWFKQRACRKWTWKSPDGTTRNEIDYMTSNTNMAKDAVVLNKIKDGNDHRLVRCKLMFNMRIERAKMVRKKRLNTDMEYLRSQTDAFQLELKNKFEMLQDMDHVETFEISIDHTLAEASERVAEKPRSC